MALKRVNTHLSQKLNEWLDEKSKESGISKSSLIAFAVERYKKEEEVTNEMPNFVEKFKEIRDYFEQESDRGSEGR